MIPDSNLSLKDVAKAVSWKGLIFICVIMLGLILFNRDYFNVTYSYIIFGFLAVLCVSAIVDYKTKRIPNIILYSFFGASIAITACFDLHYLAIHLTLSLICFITFLLINIGMNKLGSTGIGEGDVKLISYAVFVLPPIHAYIFLAVSFLIAFCFSVRKKKVAVAPFMLVGFIVLVIADKYSYYVEVLR